MTLEPANGRSRPWLASDHASAHMWFEVGTRYQALTIVEVVEYGLTLSYLYAYVCLPAWPLACLHSSLYRVACTNGLYSIAASAGQTGVSAGSLSVGSASGLSPATVCAALSTLLPDSTRRQGVISAAQSYVVVSLVNG